MIYFLVWFRHVSYKAALFYLLVEQIFVEHLLWVKR